VGLIDFVRRWVPRRARYALQEFFSLRELKLRYFESRNPLAHVVESDGTTGGSACRFGIVRNAAQHHMHFVSACLEMGLPFRVIDLYRSDWLEAVLSSGCDVLLVWADGFLRSWNTLIKDRIAILERELGFPCVPSSSELWMYEDKCRTAYWLAAKGIPHPATWVFCNRGEAEEFAAGCTLPIVFKTTFGAAASGVRIVRSRRALRALIRSAFGRGIAPGGTEWRDRQWGSMLLQEYLPDVREWRMVRVGDSFFGHLKGRIGDFHSGSGAVGWDAPKPHHLDFLLDVTERGGFRSMDVDVFETPGGLLLVNELQAVFGASISIDQSRVGGQAGRFFRSAGEWVFEPGDFARNVCANERVRDALARGLCRRKPDAVRSAS